MMSCKYLLPFQAVLCSGPRAFAQSSACPHVCLTSQCSCVIVVKALTGKQTRGHCIWNLESGTWLNHQQPALSVPQAPFYKTRSVISPSMGEQRTFICNLINLGSHWKPVVIRKQIQASCSDVQGRGVFPVAAEGVYVGRSWG